MGHKKYGKISLSVVTVTLVLAGGYAFSRYLAAQPSERTIMSDEQPQSAVGADYIPDDIPEETKVTFELVGDDNYDEYFYATQRPELDYFLSGSDIMVVNEAAVTEDNGFNIFDFLTGDSEVGITDTESLPQPAETTTTTEETAYETERAHKNNQRDEAPYEAYRPAEVTETQTARVYAEVMTNAPVTYTTDITIRSSQTLNAAKPVTTTVPTTTTSVTTTTVPTTTVPVTTTTVPTTTAPVTSTTVPTTTTAPTTTPPVTTTTVTTTAPVTTTAATTTNPAAANETLTVRVNGSVVSDTAYNIVCRIVANEVSSGFQDEAIKAQAVAAYTYVKYLNAHGSTPSVGLSGSVPPKIANCVSQVIGQAVYYNGSYAQTVYSASSAGYTSSASTVWGGYVPYLTSVACPFDTSDPNYGRTLTVSESEMRSILERYTGTQMGGDPSQWLNITSTIDGSYVGTIVINGSRTVSGRDFRERVMSFKLRSASFNVSYANGSFIFTTYGYGHGVGMSQNGANILAKSGYNYIQILSHYYTGVTVQ